jgi:hypothetical protein
MTDAAATMRGAGPIELGGFDLTDLDQLPVRVTAR